MDKKLIEKNFGDADVALSIENGKVVLSAEYSLAPLADKITDAVTTFIKKIIPGENAWEDTLAAELKDLVHKALNFEEAPAVPAKEEV